MDTCYRDANDVARLQLEAILEEREGREQGGARARGVFAARAARAAAGLTLVAGAASLPVHAVGQLARVPGLAWLDARDLLAVSWSAAAVVYGLAYLAARLGSPAAPPIRLTGDAHADLARLEAAPPLGREGSRADGLERASVAWPLAGLALLGPLSLHCAVFCLLQSRPGQFEDWAALSVALVGHAHLALAWRARRVALRLRALRLAELSAAAGQEGWGALGAAIAWSALAGVGFGLFIAFEGLDASSACIGGLAAAVVAVALVAVTGVVFVPLSFRRLGRSIERERRALDLWDAPAPAADPS